MDPEDVEIGATPTPRGTRFAAWSTRAKRVSLRLFDSAGRAVADHPLEPIGRGLFARELPDVHAGALYKFVLDGRALPDPYSRFQPLGVHGPSRVEARRPPPARRGPPLAPFAEWVLYELHLGTFTTEGTWRAAIEKLDYLVHLGITAVEVLPVAAFDGARGWGYDGAALFAPHAPYGEPDDVRAFVEAAHARGLAVVLDAVYNHLGPSGNYLGSYSPEYFTDQFDTPWGQSPNFEEPHLRALVLANVRYWLEEFGFDGLRLDATHNLYDFAASHVLSEISAIAKEVDPPRFIIAEDMRNEPELCARLGIDAVWTDDFHHALHVALTGERDGYYASYPRGPAVLARILETGWLYPGPPLAPAQFIYYLQNHDQVGNRARGDRLGTATGAAEQRAGAMLLLFLPMIPMLFMGEEWGASSPYLYFTNFEEPLGSRIAAGRRREFQSFAAFRSAGARRAIPDPQALDSFTRSRLRWDELEEPAHARTLALYRKLLELRRTEPALRSSSREGMRVEARGPLLLVQRGGLMLVLNCSDATVELPRELRGGLVLASGDDESVAEIAPREAKLVRTPIA